MYSGIQSCRSAEAVAANEAVRGVEAALVTKAASTAIAASARCSL